MPGFEQKTVKEEKANPTVKPKNFTFCQEFCKILR